MRLTLALVVAIAVLMLAAHVALALSEQDAAQIFQRGGCTACHNGAVAPNFEDVVKMIRDWASKYPSIDAAVKAESKKFKPPAHPYNSYDELMRHMRQFSPSISDKDFKALYDYFKMVFEEAKGGAAKGGGAGGAAAGIPESQAKAAFQRGGCTSCHNDVVAPKFEDIVKMIQGWASKYPSLDEAVKSESFKPPAMTHYKSFDALMKHMRQLSPSMSDEDFELVYKFFEQVFEEAKGGAGGGAAGTTTTTVGTTTTQTTTATTTAVATATTIPKPKPRMNVTTLPSVPIPGPEASRVLYSNAAIIGVALLVIALIVVGLALAKR